MRRDVFAYREPSGKKQRKHRSDSDRREREIIAVVMQQPHRLMVPDIYRNSQHAESPIGRLFLLGEIDSDDLAAAVAFRDLSVSYHRQIGAPKRLQSNADLERIRSFGGSEFELEPDEARKRWIGIRDKFDLVNDAVKEVSGEYYGAFVRLIVGETYDLVPPRILRSCLRRIDFMLRSGQRKSPV